MAALKQMSQNLVQSIQKTFRYLFGGVARLFGPTDDDYPQTGVQPFEGDIQES